jgi:hypothetical protein
MTPREIATALIAGKAVPATRKQFMDLTAAIHAALRKRNGVTVVGEGAPARWRLAVRCDSWSGGIDLSNGQDRPIRKART